MCFHAPGREKGQYPLVLPLRNQMRDACGPDDSDAVKVLKSCSKALPRRAGHTAVVAECQGPMNGILSYERWAIGEQMIPIYLQESWDRRGQIDAGITAVGEAMKTRTK